MWVVRGQQAAVETPGTDEKRYLAGSIWRTGRVILTEGKPKEGRSAALFLRHLDDLRRAFRHYKVIHSLCDSPRTHTAEDSKLAGHTATISSAQSPTCSTNSRIESGRSRGNFGPRAKRWKWRGTRPGWLRRRRFEQRLLVPNSARSALENAPNPRFPCKSSHTTNRAWGDISCVAAPGVVESGGILWNNNRLPKHDSLV